MRWRPHSAEKAAPHSDPAPAGWALSWHADLHRVLPGPRCLTPWVSSLVIPLVEVAEELRVTICVRTAPREGCGHLEFIIKVMELQGSPLCIRKAGGDLKQRSAVQCDLQPESLHTVSRCGESVGIRGQSHLLKPNMSVHSYCLVTWTFKFQLPYRWMRGCMIQALLSCDNSK